ncbi:LTA synthase family protein [Desulforhopalus vacuolatus]|nr:LTA synthase family protein [Desulforhopalus vacuolatus]
MVPLISFYAVDQDTLEIKNTTYANELAHNGMYQLFAAFRNNELDYNKFYISIPNKAAFANLRTSLKTPNSVYISNDPFDIRRQIKYSGEEKRYNIMLITVESLSASFFTRFGDQENITPNLDSIVKKSLFFTNFFATGTRTVRGMEALTLSLPPTPGYSIVKRPNNEGLFSLGSVLRSKGYLPSFIYSGMGYFDNMNSFFSHNGYETVDRKNFTEEEVSFENAWGVCDEDLYAKAMQISDDAWRKGKPFYNFLMTTSNHRPYTYPEGKIDIPSHSGRSGAVKYTDYALGKFFREARKHPWFDNTLFVIVGDHCASSAGKTVLPVANYHIPLIIYAPEILKPQEISTLSSQIDFAPTIMGLLNTSYVSNFFGKDILLNEKGRAFIGTYQKIGMLHDDTLTVEMPTKRSESFTVSGLQQTASSINEDELKDLISYYQSASYLFHTKKDKF